MYSQNICDEITSCIKNEVIVSDISVSCGEEGHFRIEVKSPNFEGKSVLDKQRLVYRAITHLMGSDDAPIHAIDYLKTDVP